VAGVLYMWGKDSDGRRKGSVCARWIPGRGFGVIGVFRVPGKKISDDLIPGVKLMRVSFRCLCESSQPSKVPSHSVDTSTQPISRTLRSGIHSEAASSSSSVGLARFSAVIIVNGCMCSKRTVASRNQTATRSLGSNDIWKWTAWLGQLRRSTGDVAC
jgi:hypothetical protein